MPCSGFSQMASGLPTSMMFGALTVLVFVGCGGSAPPPASADTVEVTPPAPSAAAPQAVEENGTDADWEGEAEATGKAPSTAEASPESSRAPETRTTEVIAKIVQDNRQPFRDCYDKNAKDQPDRKGTLTLHFVLDAEGKVKLAELNRERSTIQSPAIVDCTIGVLQTLKFPASSRGMESTVNYPFNFNR